LANSLGNGGLLQRLASFPLKRLKFIGGNTPATDLISPSNHVADPELTSSHGGDAREDPIVRSRV